MRVKCPNCDSFETEVRDSRASDDFESIRRRRRCKGCKHRFTTYERQWEDYYDDLLGNALVESRAVLTHVRDALDEVHRRYREIFSDKQPKTLLGKNMEGLRKFITEEMQ